jgi:hypothetical protein
MNNENGNDSFNDDKGNRGSNYYLPDYSRLLSFPNFKSKLAKKLTIRRDILITKKSIEENKDEKKKMKSYINFLDAEIKLIQSLLDTKEINDEV